MHYKDGTPAKLGDIVQHDNGAVGIVIGGQIGNDTCSTQVVTFTSAMSQAASAFVGNLKDAAGGVVAQAAVRVALEPWMQTREMVKIGHVDLGHG